MPVGSLRNNTICWRACAAPFVVRRKIARPAAIPATAPMMAPISEEWSSVRDKASPAAPPAMKPASGTRYAKTDTARNVSSRMPRITASPGVAPMELCTQIRCRRRPKRPARVPLAQPPLALHPPHEACRNASTSMRPPFSRTTTAFSSIIWPSRYPRVIPSTNERRVAPGTSPTTVTWWPSTFAPSTPTAPTFWCPTKPEALSGSI